MFRRESIGIGGVMAEVAVLKHDIKKAAVPEKRLVQALCKRYGVLEEAARAAIWMAEKCGVIARVGDDALRLVSREEATRKK